MRVHVCGHDSGGCMMMMVVMMVVVEITIES